MALLRKYTAEQIQAEIDRPKSKGGRPKKYHTPEEKQEAMRDANRRAYHRKRDIRDGIAIDGALVLRKAMYDTDEERHRARILNNIKYKQSHADETRLSAIVHYHKHHTP